MKFIKGMLLHYLVVALLVLGVGWGFGVAVTLRQIFAVWCITLLINISIPSRSGGGKN